MHFLKERVYDLYQILKIVLETQLIQLSYVPVTPIQRFLLNRQDWASNGEIPRLVWLCQLPCMMAWGQSLKTLELLTDLSTIKTGGYTRATQTSQDSFPEKYPEEEGKGYIIWYFSTGFSL